MNTPETRKKSGAVLGFAVLLIPFVAMALMIGQNALNLSSSEYRLKIEGYDPRDLLRGHYLIFNYAWPDGAANSCGGMANCCACLSGDKTAPDVDFQSCATIAQGDQCGTHVKLGGSWGNDQPADHLRRYYIPEQHARYLEQLLRDGDHNFEVGLVPRDGGEAQLKMLYIDGTPMPKFLNENAP